MKRKEKNAKGVSGVITTPLVWKRTLVVIVKDNMIPVILLKYFSPNLYNMSPRVVNNNTLPKRMPNPFSPNIAVKIFMMYATTGPWSIYPPARCLEYM